MQLKILGEAKTTSKKEEKKKLFAGRRGLSVKYLIDIPVDRTLGFSWAA